MNSTYPRYPLSTPNVRLFTTYGKPQGTPYTPQNIYSAYSLDESGEPGNSITIALIEAYQNPGISEDLNSFGKRYGLPATNLEVYYPFGKSSSYSRDWAIESSADTQWAYATAPYARIISVFAKDSAIDSLFEAVEYAIKIDADIISMSWGSAEFTGQQQFTDTMKASGKVFIASAGDAGGEVFFPSSSDAVVSVGGSVLYIYDDGTVFARSAWINGGGGSSKYTSIPEWQKRFNPIPSLSGNFRSTPDVALDAGTTPGYSIYNSAEGGFFSVGGTSISAPVFSGICARIMQRNPDILQKEGSMSAYLYRLAGYTSYSETQYYFDDIVIGSNGKYKALKGYDLCTGLGTPVGKQLILG